MAISLKHLFQSAKGDSLDTTLVQPSNWNAEHVLECASGVVLGRTSAGAGPVEELTDVRFPTGTKMLFQQTAAPTGWTKDITHNNKALRVVSGTAGSGGTSPFSTVFGKTATDGHALTTAQLPSHSHASGTLAGGSHTHNSGTYGTSSHSHPYLGHDTTVGIDSPLGTRTTDLLKGTQTRNTSTNTADVSGSSGAASVSISGSTAAEGSGATHAHNIELRVQYVDLIIATKD